MENKVYLRVGTPRTLKDPVTLKMVIMMVGCCLGMVAVTVMMFVQGSEIAPRFAIIAVVWLFSGAIPCTLLIFNSYARIEDRELVINNLGFSEKRIPFSQVEKAAKQNGRIAIYAGGKTVVTMPDNEAARGLLRRLPVDLPV